MAEVTEFSYSSKISHSGVLDLVDEPQEKAAEEMLQLYEREKKAGFDEMLELANTPLNESHDILISTLKLLDDTTSERRKYIHRTLRSGSEETHISTVPWRSPDGNLTVNDIDYVINSDVDGERLTFDILSSPWEEGKTMRQAQEDPKSLTNWKVDLYQDYTGGPTLALVFFEEFDKDGHSVVTHLNTFKKQGAEWDMVAEGEEAELMFENHAKPTAGSEDDIETSFKHHEPSPMAWLDKKHLKDKPGKKENLPDTEPSREPAKV